MLNICDGKLTFQVKLLCETRYFAGSVVFSQNSNRMEVKSIKTMDLINEIKCIRSMSA